jgi:hypothetical protein
VYHALTEEQMTAGIRAHGMPDSAISYLAMLYSVVRAGAAASITSDVETVIGRKPIDFQICWVSSQRMEMMATPM